jgi:hypothetical protein
VETTKDYTQSALDTTKNYGHQGVDTTKDYTSKAKDTTVHIVTPKDHDTALSDHVTETLNNLPAKVKDIVASYTQASLTHWEKNFTASPTTSPHNLIHCLKGWAHGGSSRPCVAAGPVAQESGALPVGPAGHKAVAAQPRPPQGDGWAPVSFEGQVVFFSIEFFLLV